MEGELDDSEHDRRYPCPKQGCYKAYRQPSGLRYHIKNVGPFRLSLFLSPFA